MMSKAGVRVGTWLLAAVLLAHAGDEKTRIFRGQIADTQCALNIHSLTRSHTEMLKSKKMGGTPGACSTYCVRYLGGDFVLSSKDEVYRLDNQEKVGQFAGQKVKITGTMELKSKTIHVVTIEPAE
jgi:hypothetical protein